MSISRFAVGRGWRLVVFSFFSMALWAPPATAPALAHDTVKAEVIAELPGQVEGIAQDSEGRIYVTVVFTGEVVQLDGKGGYKHVAWLPSEEERGRGAAVGLEATATGDLIVAYADMKSRYSLINTGDFGHHNMACKDSTDQLTGIYKVIVKTGEVVPLATKADGWPFCIPDDIAIDGDGNIFVSDLTFSGIWKISPDGKDVQLFSGHRLLQPGEFPVSGHFLGVNVIVFSNDGKTLYAGTDGTPMVLGIPINDDGSAGEIYKIATGFAPIDGIDIDDEGNIYISEASANEITALSPDGEIRITIANRLNAPLHTNTSLLYQNGRLCTSNLGSKPNGEPAKTVVCISNFPKPSDMPGYTAPK